MKLSPIRLNISSSANFIGIVMLHSFCRGRCSIMLIITGSLTLSYITFYKMLYVQLYYTTTCVLNSTVFRHYLWVYNLWHVASSTCEVGACQDLPLEDLWDLPRSYTWTIWPPHTSEGWLELSVTGTFNASFSENWSAHSIPQHLMTGNPGFSRISGSGNRGFF